MAQAAHRRQGCLTASTLFGKWSRRSGLNGRPADYESAALPTELRRLAGGNCKDTTPDRLIRLHAPSPPHARMFWTCRTSEERHLQFRAAGGYAWQTRNLESSGW